MKLRTLKEGNPFETWNFQSGKFTGTLDQNLAFPNKAIHMKIGNFICSSEIGYFQTRKIHTRFSPFNREIHMTFDTLKQRNLNEKELQF